MAHFHNNGNPINHWTLMKDAVGTKLKFTLSSETVDTLEHTGEVIEATVVNAILYAKKDYTLRCSCRKQYKGIATEVTLDDGRVFDMRDFYNIEELEEK